MTPACLGSSAKPALNRQLGRISFSPGAAGGLSKTHGG